MTDYRVTILETSDEEVEFAIGWHSGQSSPLYSVASCGNFVRGEHIPYPHENCAEYEVSLLWDLLIELKDCDPWQDSPRNYHVNNSYRLVVVGRSSGVRH